MEDAEKDLQQHPDSIQEVGEDAVTTVGPSAAAAAVDAMTEEERQELQEELVKVEDEIQTLSQVLAAKEKQLADIKRKLGITPLNELKQNITKTWQEVTTSNAYRRTSETLSHAGLKASVAFTSMGSAITRKLEDVSIRSIQHSASMPVIRNAPTFKSFEEKVGTLKTKMSPSASTSDAANQDDSDGGGEDPTNEPLFDPPEAPPTQDMPMH